MLQTYFKNASLSFEIRMSAPEFPQFLLVDVPLQKHLCYGHVLLSFLSS